MHPLKQLKRLLNESQPNHGKVLKVGSELQIATRQGMQTITPLPNDATRYQVGDSVVLANGVVVGRRNRQPKVYVV